MRNKVAALIGASAFIGASVFTVLGVLGAAPTFGADSATCTTVVHHDLTGVKIDNDNDGTTTSATTTLLDDGVEITTPDDSSKMYVRFPTDFALADVTRMTYRTYRYATSTDASVVPMYEIEVLLSGHANTAADPLPAGWTGEWSTTLVYEPDQAEGSSAITENAWQTWDAYQGGAATWWSTHTLTAVAGDAGQSTPETWSSILAAYPNAVGYDYYIDQGTNNKGAVTAFNDVTFGTSASCTTQEWTDVSPPTAVPSSSAGRPSGMAGYSGPAPNVSVTPTPTTKSGSGTSPPAPGAAAVVSPSPSDNAVATAVDAPDAGVSIGGLALTGPDFIVPAGFGLLLTITGAVLFRIAHRRRQAGF